jgi:hypothetical protein
MTATLENQNDELKQSSKASRKRRSCLLDALAPQLAPDGEAIPPRHAAGGNEGNHIQLLRRASAGDASATAVFTRCGWSSRRDTAAVRRGGRATALYGRRRNPMRQVLAAQGPSRTGRTGNPPSPNFGGIIAVAGEAGQMQRFKAEQCPALRRPGASAQRLGIQGPSSFVKLCKALARADRRLGSRGTGERPSGATGGLGRKLETLHVVTCKLPGQTGNVAIPVVPTGFNRFQPLFKKIMKPMLAYGCEPHGRPDAIPQWWDRQTGLSADIRRYPTIEF